MKLKALVLGVAASALLTGAANAATYLFTVSGMNGTAGVSAQADVTIDASGATIVLTNLFGNPTSVASELAGIQFFVDSVPTSDSLTSASGNELAFFSAKTCGGKPGCVPSPAHVDDVTDGVIEHWGAATGATWFSISTANSAFGAQSGGPVDLIVGPSPYTNFNASIPGDNPHINQVGTFHLAFTGLTGTPNITGVNFLFGTDGASVTGGGSCTADCGGGGQGGVPEPATWAMMIMGFGGVGAILRRRRTVFA